MMHEGPKSIMLERSDWFANACKSKHELSHSEPSKQFFPVGAMPLEGAMPGNAARCVRQPSRALVLAVPLKDQQAAGLSASKMRKGLALA